MANKNLDDYTLDELFDYIEDREIREAEDKFSFQKDPLFKEILFISDEMRAVVDENMCRLKVNNDKEVQQIIASIKDKIKLLAKKYKVSQREIKDMLF